MKINNFKVFCLFILACAVISRQERWNDDRNNFIYFLMYYFATLISLTSLYIKSTVIYARLTSLKSISWKPPHRPLPKTLSKDLPRNPQLVASAGRSRLTTLGTRIPRARRLEILPNIVDKNIRTKHY